MNRKLAAIVTAAVVSVGGLGTFVGQSVAAPKSAYPKPVRPYVAHPKGFNDAADVKVSGGSISCPGIKTAAAGHKGKKVHVRTELAPLVSELLRITEEKHGYQIKQLGGYNCRMIRGSASTPSNHAYARAVDINWNQNPMSSSFSSDMPPAMVATWMKYGFYWGGHYTSRPDTMHFEYIGDRAKIAEYLAAAKKDGVKSQPTKAPTTTKKPTSKPTTKAPTKPTSPKPTTSKPTRSPLPCVRPLVKEQPKPVANEPGTNRPVAQAAVQLGGDSVGDRAKRDRDDLDRAKIEELDQARRVEPCPTAPPCPTMVPQVDRKTGKDMAIRCMSPTAKPTTIKPTSKPTTTKPTSKPTTTKPTSKPTTTKPTSNPTTTKPTPNPTTTKPAPPKATEVPTSEPTVPPVEEPAPPVEEPAPPVEEPAPPVEEPAPPVDEAPAPEEGSDLPPADAKDHDHAEETAYPQGLADTGATDDALPLLLGGIGLIGTGAWVIRRGWQGKK